MEETLTVIAPSTSLILIAIAAMGGAFVTWVVVKIKSLGGDRYNVTIRRKR